MDGIGIWIFGFIIVAVLFFAIREIATWYLKIDLMIQNQDTQNALLRAILEELKKSRTKTHPTGSEVEL